MTQINFQQVKSLFGQLTEVSMQANWSRLHAGDLEPYPQSSALIEAWLKFHNGDFLASATCAQPLGEGLSLQLKALSTYAHYLEQDPQKKIAQFLEIVELAEKGLIVSATNKTNLYYQIAYGLGRYGQFISIPKALAEGIAGKVQDALAQCLALTSDHADAHTAFATYQAEIIGKLGKIAGKLTYGVNGDSAISHYEKAIELAPFSISAKTEYADGLLVLFGKKQLKQAVHWYQAAVENDPIDALEALDYTVAKQELADR